MIERCPTCPPDDERWIDKDLTRLMRVAHDQTDPTFEAMETGVTVAIGLGRAAVAALVLRRRRAVGAVSDDPGPAQEAAVQHRDRPSPG